MKNFSKIFTVAAAIVLSAVAFRVSAEDKKTDKPKSYPLTTCVVSDEKLGEMGKPYVFTQDGQEIKLCCKSCLKDFQKDPAKYLKKVETAAPKAKKS